VNLEHAPTAEPAPPSPSDGSAIPHDEPTQAGGGGVLSHTEERQLFLDDPDQWCEYVAPRWVVMLTDADDEHVLQLWRISEAERPSRHVAVWSISEPQGPALVTLALAMRARAGSGVWRALQELGAMDEDARARICRADPPPAPWLAVALHLPSLLPVPHPALHWLGDAERCIAWAWIEEIFGGGYLADPAQGVDQGGESLAVRAGRTVGYIDGGSYHHDSCCRWAASVPVCGLFCVLCTCRGA
jgi:hypothetical protein